MSPVPEREAQLQAWLALCGATEMDHSLFKFLRAEVMAATADSQHDVLVWRRILVDLVNTCLSKGISMPRGRRGWRNAESKTPRSVCWRHSPALCLQLPTMMSRAQIFLMGMKEGHCIACWDLVQRTPSPAVA